MSKANYILFLDCLVSMAICILVELNHIQLPPYLIFLLWALWFIKIFTMQLAKELSRHFQWLKSEGYEEIL